jgi:hypothetical protein
MTKAVDAAAQAEADQLRSRVEELPGQTILMHVILGLRNRQDG